MYRSLTRLFYVQRWDSTEVGGGRDISTAATAEDEWGCITTSLAERRRATVQGVVYSERYRRLLLCTKWQKSIYAEPVLRFVRIVRRVREQVLLEGRTWSCGREE